jgi:oleate hydratase
MEAVYTLLGVDRGVPEVFNSTFDVRSLLAAISPLRDGQAIAWPGPTFLHKLLLERLDGTEIGELLKEFHLAPE